MNHFIDGQPPTAPYRFAASFALCIAGIFALLCMVAAVDRITPTPTPTPAIERPQP